MFPDSPEKATSFDDVQDESYGEVTQYMKDLTVELGVSVECAGDVWYLRTRSRHTSELEAELIALHAAGTPPNMCDFGVTKDTQAFIRESCAEV
jgi:hypothetical protein